MKKENIFLIIAIIIFSVMICIALIHDNNPERKFSSFENIVFVVCMVLSPFAGTYIFVMQYRNKYMFILWMIPFALFGLFVGSIWIACAMYFIYAIFESIYFLIIENKVLFIDYSFKINLHTYVIMLIIAFVLEIPYVIFLYLSDRKSDNSKVTGILDKFKRR